MKKEFKGFICGVVATIVVAGTASGVGVWDSIDVLKNDIRVVVDGNVVTADNFLYNDTTYLPLRAVSNALGENVEYDEIDNTAYIGERIDKDTMKSKYTPPNELQDGVLTICKDGEYFITMNYVVELAKEKSLDTNFDDLLKNPNLPVVINGQTWKTTVINDIHYIPYDTYVDEIEPLLK